MLTGYLSARLTGDEEERVKMRADAAGISKSEWCRQTVLQALDTSADTRLLLSELLALRKIFILLQVDLSEGNKPSPDRLRNAVEQAEATKLAMAEGRIRSFPLHPKTVIDEARKDE